MMYKLGLSKIIHRCVQGIHAIITSLDARIDVSKLDKVNHTYHDLHRSIVFLWVHRHLGSVEVHIFIYPSDLRLGRLTVYPTRHQMNIPSERREMASGTTVR